MVTGNGYISRCALDPRIPLLVEPQAQGYTVVARVAGMRANSRVPVPYLCLITLIRACVHARLRIYSSPEYLFTRVYMSGANCGVD